MPQTNANATPNAPSASSSKNPQQMDMTLNGGGNISLRIAVDIQSNPAGSTAVASLVGGGSQENKEPGDGRVFHESDE